MSCYSAHTLSHCSIKFVAGISRESHLSLHLLLISSSCLAKLSMCDRKDQAFSKLPESESWRPFKCCRVAFEVKKRKKSWGERVKKKLSALTFPPFSTLFVPLWTCCPWMRHKGSRGERPKNRCERLTQILFTEPAAEPNAHSLLCMCMCIYIQPPP